MSKGLSEATKPTQLTSSRKWCLEAAAKSSVAGGYNGPSVITNFKTGQVTFGCRTGVVEKCKAAGWLNDDGTITPAGRAALASRLKED